MKLTLTHQLYESKNSAQINFKHLTLQDKRLHLKLSRILKLCVLNLSDFVFGFASKNLCSILLLIIVRNHFMLVIIFCQLSLVKLVG